MCRQKPFLLSLIGLFVFLGWFESALAQNIVWTKTYGGIQDDAGYSIQECADGGFIIAGTTYSFSMGGSDVYLIRIDVDGDTLWTKTYGGTGGDYAKSVEVCPDGGFIIAGSTNSFGAGGSDVYIIRTNSLGDTLWTKTCGGANDDAGFSVQRCLSGGFIIAGYTYSFGAGHWDVYLIRTDSLGDTLWTKTYGGIDYDVGFSVEECSDSGFIITGMTYSFGAGDADIYLIRTDSWGNTIWTKTYGGTKYDAGYSVQECASGSFIITGRTLSFGIYWAHPYLLKTDAGGNLLWIKTYAGGGGDAGCSVKEASSGGFMIVGWAYSTVNASEVYLARTDANGDTLWTKYFGGGNYDAGYSLNRCASGGFIIAGETKSFGAGGSDVYIIRLAETGIEEDLEASVSDGLIVYPNPTLGDVIIEYELPEEGEVTLRLYDAGGRLVRSLYPGKQNRGIHKIEMKKDGLNAGIYFIEFISSIFKIRTEKLTILK